MGGNVWDGYWWRQWFASRADYSEFDPDYYVMEAGLNATAANPDGTTRIGEQVWTYFPEPFWGKMSFFGTKLSSGQVNEYLKQAGKIAIHNSWWWNWPCKEGTQWTSCSDFQPPPWNQTAVENLLTALPNWENKNEAQNRQYDNGAISYQSLISRANREIVHSINPTDHKTYTVFLSANAQLPLNNRQVVSIKRTDNIWQEQGNGNNDFEVIDNTLKLKSADNVNRGYIIEFQAGPGDLNCDKIVNEGDLSVALTEWGTTLTNNCLSGVPINELVLSQILSNWRKQY